MKNGLLVYSSGYGAFNIGDYIQSLAARQFLGRIDAFLCREALDEYKGDEIRLILNGWFTHEPSRWPPAPQIHPLFVSFHINSVAQKELTSIASLDYLRRWAPIGCRDRGTAALLRGAGVEAYFSGCLTLTLGRSWSRRRTDGPICFVDPYFEFKRDVRSLASYAQVLSRHPRVVGAIAARMFGNRDIRSLLKASAFYASYRGMFTEETLLSAVYERHQLANADFDGDAEKFERAEALLGRYAAAKFVVTSRIHCALPCLGIGTPVLYVENELQAETSACRLDGLRELFHVVVCGGGTLRSEFVRERVTPDFSFANKRDHVALVAKLAETCEAFAQQAPSPSN